MEYAQQTVVDFLNGKLDIVEFRRLYDEKPEIDAFLQNIIDEMKKDTDFNKYRKYISSLGLDSEKMDKYYRDISTFEPDKIQSISNIASMLAKHILLENMFRRYSSEK